MSAIFLSSKPNVLHIFPKRDNVVCVNHEDIDYA